MGSNPTPATIFFGRVIIAKLNKKNVLVIGDTHIPFEKKGYLEFCKSIQKKKNCGTVVHIGDLVDNHSISYHEHDPDLWSPIQEMEEADVVLKKWFKAFPELKLTRGNHDCLVDRKAKTIGLPRRCFKPYREIWDLPDAWQDEFEFVIDGVLYKHSNASGKLAHLNQAISNMCSTVIGHAHAFAGIAYTASPTACIFGMNPGCGVDVKALAFAYGKDFPHKPIVSCGTVENGEAPQIHRMML